MSENLNAFNTGVNVLSFRKNEKNYSMTCAWATMLDYDKVGMLIGAQSITGKSIKVGDIVGISALASDQKEIGVFIGTNHSDKVDKLKKVSYTIKGTAIFINNAKVTLEAKVIEILTLPHILDDKFIMFEILSHNEDETKEFLNY